jgi:hypothetical protein
LGFKILQATGILYIMIASGMNIALTAGILKEYWPGCWEEKLD